MSATQEKYPGVPKWHIPKLTRDQHPTALDIIKRDTVSLVNKTVLVTGGSAGIGIETVRAFASAGARVFVLVRSVDKTRVILDKINAEYPQNGGLEIVQGELDSLASVNAAANDFLKRSDQLNILVNNAGIYQAPFALTVDGYESHLAIDHIAHQLLFKTLLPLLIKSSTPQFHSRVVAVASTVHILANVDFADLNYTNGRPYTHSSAYNQAKLANIWFANHVEKLYGSQGVHGLSLHPGLIQTESLFNAPREIMINSGMFTPEGDYRSPGLAKDEEQGAATTVWASVSPDLEGKGGIYLEDVAITKPATPGVLKGYTSAAVDETQATKMWDWTEQAISKFVTA